MTPEQLPDAVFAAIGRTVWQDIGPTAVAFRCALPLAAGLLYKLCCIKALQSYAHIAPAGSALRQSYAHASRRGCTGRVLTQRSCRLLMKVVDYNLLASITALAGPLLPDFRKAQAQGKGKLA